MMFTHSRPSRLLAKNPVTGALAKQVKNGAWPLKIGQTIFVGITVITFVLLFQGK